MQGSLEIEPDKAVANYIKSVNKGVVKVLSKMGISTIRSYLGAQIFEALGISDVVIEKYFAGTAARLGGIGLNEIAEEALIRHKQAFDSRSEIDWLETGGNYQWRETGEFHLFNPQTIHALQRSCRTGDYKVFKEFSRAVNEQAPNSATLRSFLKFKQGNQAIPIEEVEPLEKILARFKPGRCLTGRSAAKRMKLWQLR